MMFAGGHYNLDRIFPVITSALINRMLTEAGNLCVVVHWL